MTSSNLDLKHPIGLALTSALLIVSACTTAQPNPRLADAQSRLSAAYNDKETAERGQGDLANAKAALQSSQQDWKHGDKAQSEHNLNMGQTYLDLAETRGQQAKFEAANASQATNARMNDKNMQIAAKDQMIISKDQMIVSKNNQLADKDAQLAQAKDDLRGYNMQPTDLGSTMVLQDVSFETGKSQLLPGGVNRMQPLINYLRLSPDTQVRIEGYTDNVGGADYNQQLSLDRANAVRAILSAGGIGNERIATYGSGLNKPVATNTTAAGRQSNRRVEVTLLKQPTL